MWATTSPGLVLGGAFQKEVVYLSANTIAAEHDTATIKAEGERNGALDVWFQNASTTWNRMRKHVLSTSMVHPVRLLITAQLAYMSATIPGDFVETGVAQGGASILMMAVLDDLNDQSKRHFACDSFLGLPVGMKQDFSRNNNCSSVSRGETGAMSCGHARGNVKEAETLTRFKGQFKFPKSAFRAAVLQSGVTSTRMVIVEGWFNKTLPPPNLDRIAFLRLDGDLYGSTRDALHALYSRLSSGGVIYVDDYGSFGGCKVAVDEFRKRHGITTPMTKVWQNFTGIRHGQFVTPQARAGYGFEAVWWTKD